MATTAKKKQSSLQKSEDIEKLKKYLTDLGYFNPVDQVDDRFDLLPNPEDLNTSSSKKSSGMDSETKIALMRFQKFHGLDISGELDKKTINQINTKRCACPDHDDFTLDGRKWNKTVLTYGFKNYSPDLSRADIEQAIVQAFALWAAETPLIFRKISYSANPDIRIEFKHQDRPGGTLAFAYYPPPNGGNLAGDAQFDEFEKWTVEIPTGINKIDLVTVAAHEFGHSLGLRHSSISNSLMFPSYSGPQRYLDNDDINGIKKIYGSYKIAQASWIHGTSMQVEYPDRLSAIRRFGFFTYLTGKPNSINWFHFAIPSPVIVNNKRLKIAAAILRFRTFSDKAIVKHVHIYDGYSKIAAHNNVNLHGNQLFRKFGVAHKPSIYWGLGISIGVEFKGGSNTNRRMDFISAGCDLVK